MTHLSAMYRHISLKGARVLMVGLLAAAGATAADTGSPRRQTKSGTLAVAAESCGVPTWSPPRILETKSGAPAYVESAFLVEAKGTRYLLGAPSILWESPTTFSSPIATTADLNRAVARTRLVGVVLDANQRATALPAPPGVRTVFAPIAAASADGTLHMLWAAPSDTTTNDTPSIVWYASYKNGRWRRPERLFSATELDWRPSQRPQLLSEHGRIHVLFSSWTKGKGSSVDYLRYSNAAWTHARLAHVGLGVATMAIPSPDSIIVVYGASDASARVRNGSHLYVTRAAQRDTLWQPGTLIEWRGLGGVLFPILFMEERGPRYGLTLVWGGFNPDTHRVDSLFVSLSADGGTVWDRPAGLAIGGGASSLVVTKTSDQTLHLIYGWRPPGAISAGARLGYAAWRRSHWLSPRSPLPDSAESVPTLSAFAGDSLLATWAVGRHASANDPREAPVLEFVFGRSAACAAESVRRP